MKTFPIGGVHPADNKLSRAVAVERFALPDEVRIPLAQHIGAPAVAKVAKGDKVLAGQLIAEAASFMSANIHAPVSGTVTAVDLQPNGQGVRQMMITIKREGDEWVPEVDLTPDLVRECTLEPKEILDRIKAAGIVGMGGATFPTHVKLSVPPGKKTEFLIINGVECEPYLTSDHRTMLEKGEELMVGTTILMRVLGVKQAQIGIENNKPDAIAFLRELSKHYEGVRVTPLKVRYPQGGEKQLIAAVTGLLACACGGTETERLHRAAMREYLNPIRPGYEGRNPFWNAFARKYIYAPAFGFAPVESAVKYRFTVSHLGTSMVESPRYRKDAPTEDPEPRRVLGPGVPTGRSWSFEADSPQQSLAPVWNDIPVGRVQVTAEGLDASGRILGKAGEREFLRDFPFRPPYNGNVRPYAEAARMAALHIHELPAIRHWLTASEPDMTYRHNTYACKILL